MQLLGVEVTVHMADDFHSAPSAAGSLDNVNSLVLLKLHLWLQSRPEVFLPIADSGWSDHAIQRLTKESIYRAHCGKGKFQ